MDESSDANRLVLSVPLDGRHVATVRAALTHLLDTTFGDVILEVSAVESVDATGLAVLAAAHRRAQREGRHLVLHGCQGSLRRVLARTKLSRVLRLEPAEVSA